MDIFPSSNGDDDHFWKTSARRSELRGLAREITTRRAEHRCWPNKTCLGMKLFLKQSDGGKHLHSQLETKLRPPVRKKSSFPRYYMLNVQEFIALYSVIIPQIVKALLYPRFDYTFTHEQSPDSSPHHLLPHPSVSTLLILPITSTPSNSRFFLPSSLPFPLSASSISILLLSRL